MITTKNRADDLRRTIDAIKAMDPQPDDLLITADGCSDDTVACVKTLAPNARLFVNPEGRGSVASRDRMLRAATTDLVLSLDDDSYPEQQECVTKLKSLFRSLPELAVAHFPQRTDEYPASLKQTEFGLPRLTGSYANSGACYNRQVFIDLGGFEDSFFHVYEEPDYALRCIAKGLHVLYWPHLIIRHHYSPSGRRQINSHHKHARNELWSSLMRCPFPLVFIMIPYRMLSQMRYAFTRGRDWVVREPTWWLAAIQGSSAALKKRKPVSFRGYLRWLFIARRPKPIKVTV